MIPLRCRLKPLRWFVNRVELQVCRSSVLCQRCHRWLRVKRGGICASLRLLTVTFNIGERAETLVGVADAIQMVQPNVALGYPVMHLVMESMAVARLLFHLCLRRIC